MSRTLLSRVAILLVGAVVVAATGCASDEDEGGRTGTPAAVQTATPDPTFDGDGNTSKLVTSEVPRRPSSRVAVRSVGAASELFAVDLYLALVEGNVGNVVLSPYSVAVALAMTLNGARGQTATEIETVLHAELTRDLNSGFNSIDQKLADVPGEYEIGMPSDDPVVVELSTANQLWGQQGLNFHSEFLDELAANYGAGIRLVDYASDTEAARQSINGWVSDETRERIPELLQQGALTADTRLVLTNAIYLNAPWLYPFLEDSTSNDIFTTLAGDEVVVSMMQLNRVLRYASGDGYQAVVLPYADGSLSMLVVVPDEGSFDFVEGRIGDVVGEIDAEVIRPEVRLEFPRFEFRMKAALKPALIDLGMPTAFGGGADFSEMTDETELVIKDVVHEAFISVDEEGTEAAAATAVIGVRMSAQHEPPEPVQLTVDRPFLFLIRHDETGAVLFMGRVADPSAE